MSLSLWDVMSYLGIREALCINMYYLRTNIIVEAQCFRYSIHPCSTKIYHDLKDIYWWDGIKKNIAECVAKCLNCQHIKAEYLKHDGLTQMVEVPTWKCEDINKDFMVGLPRTSRQHVSLWVIVDRLTKSSHFIPVNFLQSLGICETLH